MERITRFRVGLVLAFFCVVLGIYALKLYDLQLIQTGGSVDNTKTFTTYTTVKAARGEILDCNGNVLVTNRASYDMVFNHYVICSAEDTNGRLLQLVELCRKLDVEYIDHFPVTKTAPFTDTRSDYNSAWQGYFQKYLTKKGNLDSDISAPLLIKKLREQYKIPETWSEVDARAVIGIRYELDLRQGITNLSNYIFLEDVDNHTLSGILELSVPGLKAEASTVRKYNTQYAAHILGYVGPVTAKQWESTYKNKEGYSLDAMVGQSGFEMVFEEYLHATDGVRVDITTVDGTVVDSYYTVKPKAGQNVEVSIDLSVQSTAEKQLEALIVGLRKAGEGLAEGEEMPDGADAEGGAVVVMNVKTGQILACASYPTYDLSTFREDYNKLLETDYAPLYNRALLATYPPGSTYKMSMVIAGIDSGSVDKDTIIWDDGVYTKYSDSGYTPKCLHYTKYGYGHGEVNAMLALRDSCNYYFYAVADKMSIADMDAIAKSLGLGEKTGVELQEHQGHRANDQTHMELFGNKMSPGDKIAASIGQSENRFTPMQLCVYTATLANRGVRYSATFLNRVLSADYSAVTHQYQPEIVSKLEISDEAFSAYTEGMRLVVTEGTGTRYFKNYPIAVAAKTGTAEHGSGGSDNGAFVCYAPYDDPEIAVVVYVEKGGHGSTVAQVAKSVTDVYFAEILSGDTNAGENQIS